MPAPPLAPTTRYFPPGTRKVYWVPVISNYLAPTRAELNAGTDLSAEISALTGWSVTANMVDAPDMGSKFTSQVGGRLTSAQNDITCYLSQNSIDARTLLPRSTTGYVVLLWEGDIPGQKMSVFPVVVTTQAPDTATENVGTATFSFAASRVPAENLTIPA
jgi:hypothetical protein